MQLWASPKPHYQRSEAYRQRRARSWSDGQPIWRGPLHKTAFNNNDIYVKSIDNGENFYEEPQDSKTNEEHESKENNMKIFYKLNVNDNPNIASTPHEEEFSNKYYEAIEVCEIAL